MELFNVHKHIQAVPKMNGQRKKSIRCETLVEFLTVALTYTMHSYTLCGLNFKMSNFSTAKDGFVLCPLLFLSFLPWWRLICSVNSTFPLFLFLISGILFILVSHILNHHPFSCLFSLSLSAECLIPELGSSQQITALISLIISQYVTGSLRRLLANTSIWSAVWGGIEEVRHESRQGVRK